MRLLGRWKYSSEYDPKAPVVQAKITGVHPTAISAFIDSGADLSVISNAKAVEAGLAKEPPITAVFLKSPDYVGMAPVFEVRVGIGGDTYLLSIAVAPVKEDAILGRDLLNLLVLRLDGPNETTSIYTK